MTTLQPPQLVETPMPSTTNFYFSAWKRMPRDLGYLGLTALLLVSAYALFGAIIWGGIGSITALVGIAIVVGGLYAARWLGSIELTRIGWAQSGPIRPVRWKARTGSNWFTRFFSAGADPHYWLYLLHAFVVFPIVATVTTIVSFTWAVSAVGSLVFFPFARFDFGRSGNIDTDNALFGSPLGMLLSLLAGIVLLATLPFVTRGFTLLHFQVDKLLLSGFRSEVLAAQVGTLETSRGAAVAAEGHSLRRLERDIHDGPQQRLVRMQMDLAAADRQLDKDPGKARELIAEATQQAKDALEELRALSRGFAPPILLDRGLVAALESLGDRSSLPVRVVSEVGEAQFGREIERNAYFVASEAVANASKHAEASEIIIRLWQRIDEQNSWLDITVTDDGKGGARALEGHGLAGLEERLRGLGGTLEVRSVAGEGTTLIANLPITL